MIENFYAWHCWTYSMGNPNIYVCVFIYGYFWALNTVHLCAILDVLFLFSTRLAAMQLWRRKSMQWVEAPMENSLNLLSVMTPGLSSGRRSVLWKREGEQTRLPCAIFFNALVSGGCLFSESQRSYGFYHVWVMVNPSYNANVWTSKDKHPGNK